MRSAEGPRAAGEDRLPSHLAISIAAADQGFASKDALGTAGEPGVKLDGSGCSSAGVISGEEKHSKYKAMKKSSLRAQQTKRTA